MAHHFIAAEREILYRMRKAGTPGCRTGFAMEFGVACHEGGGLQLAAWKVGKMKMPSEARRLSCHKMNRIWWNGSAQCCWGN